MTLHDPDAIKQAKKTHQSEVETLYWLLEDSLYTNHIEKAKWVYTMLLYIAKYQSDLLAKGLRKRHLERLREIAYELHSESPIKKRSSITIKPGASARKIPFTKEKELQDHLYDHPGILSEALSDRVRVVGKEVETDFEYRCDLVAQSEDSFYPIELKIGETTHAVVSQIQKYCFYFYRKLRYSLYRDIKGVVIASGFDSWSINELRRDGIKLFQIRSDGNDGILLSTIS